MFAASLRRLLQGLWVLFACAGLPGGAFGKAPDLRLETGAHVAPIRAAATDAAGRFLLTASEDKTARLWDLASGNLLSIFRPPSAPGNEGKLFAAALAPDASVFAVGGWSTGNDVYLVKRTDGRISHRIAGLPNVITALAFSPDGQILAIGLWGKQGVRIFASRDGWQTARELRGDPAYAGEVNALAWSPDGRQLMASAADGLLRAYEATPEGIRLHVSAQPPGIGTPHGMAFSPDGTSLALGSSDQAAVALVSPATLKVARQLQPASTQPNRSLSSVAWSADGHQLFAAGTWVDERGRFAIAAWPNRGSGAATTMDGAGNTITALLPHLRGLIHASADPAWSLLDPQGRRLVSTSAGGLDFRNSRSKFLLAPDGSAVSFSGASGQPVLAFDLRQGAWTKPGKDWQAPRTLATRSSVDNWFERARPQINGKTVNLDNNELSLSASVSANGERIAIAASQNLRLFDRSAQLLWQVPVVATPWQVNLSADGRWVVTAYSDGTLRWYRTSDGQEQLALFPHADQRRWVAWAPGGHFSVSPGGEGLVGWQLDRGAAQAADFFPLSRFRAEFYAPALIGEIFNQGSLDAALASQSKPAAPPPAVSERLPPTVRVLAPEDMSTSAGHSIKLRIAIQAPVDAPATGLRARINGTLVPSGSLPALRKESAGSSEQVLEFPLDLPPGDAQILLFAENRHGVSPEAALRVKRPVASPPPAEPEPVPLDFRPALYVLAIGVSKYADPSIRLEFPAKDANDLVSFLKSQEGGLYRKVSVRLLTDANARRNEVLDGLEWVRREMTARDVAVVFLAGHGINDADGVYYFLPEDADPRALKRSAVIFTEIRNTLVSLPGKALFFVDSCHAGNVLGTGTRSLRNDTTAIVNELSSADNGVIVFAASTGRQFALESREWGNGAFTKAILEGLRGQADLGRSGRVTHKMLDLYISERVKRLTDGAQSPVTIVPNGVPDFPLVLNKRPAR